MAMGRGDDSRMGSVNVDAVVGETTCKGQCEEHVGKFGTTVARNVVGLRWVVEGVEINSDAWGKVLVGDGGDCNDSGGLRFLDPVQKSRCKDEVAISCVVIGKM